MTQYDLTILWALPGCHEPAAFSPKQTHHVCVIRVTLMPTETDSLRHASEEKFEPAIVIPRQRGHNPFLTDFAPITLVEHVADTGENSGSPFPESKFGRQIPNVEQCQNV
jgi:hypothetical protein